MSGRGISQKGPNICLRDTTTHMTTLPAKTGPKASFDMESMSAKAVATAMLLPSDAARSDGTAPSADGDVGASGDAGVARRNVLPAAPGFA